MSAESDDVLGQIAKGGFYVPTVADSGLSGVVVGEVELVRLMASGATSNVWEGRHRTAGVSVAVKIACRSGDAALNARFAHEAEMLEKVLPCRARAMRSETSSLRPLTRSRPCIGRAISTRT